jgi:hypothetical protein
MPIRHLRKGKKEEEKNCTCFVFIEGHSSFQPTDGVHGCISLPESPQIRSEALASTRAAISLSSQLLAAAEHLSTGLVQSPGLSPSSTGSGSDGDSD